MSGSKKTRRGFDSGTRAGSGNALVDADSKADVFQQENGIYERGWIAKSAGTLRAYYCRFGLVSLRENWKHVLFVERGKSDTTQYCMLVCVGAQGILIFCGNHEQSCASSALYMFVCRGVRLFFMRGWSSRVAHSTMGAYAHLRAPLEQEQAQGCTPRKMLACSVRYRFSGITYCILRALALFRASLKREHQDSTCSVRHWNASILGSIMSAMLVFGRDTS